MKVRFRKAMWAQLAGGRSWATAGTLRVRANGNATKRAQARAQPSMLRRLGRRPISVG